MPIVASFLDIWNINIRKEIKKIPRNVFIYTIHYFKLQFFFSFKIKGLHCFYVLKENREQQQLIQTQNYLFKKS